MGDTIEQHRRHLGVSDAIRILDALVAAEVAIEVTHRSKRRLFGLKGLTPLRDVVGPPYRPDPARGPGRPSFEMEEEPAEADFAPLPPLTPIERQAFNYTALEEAMAHLDAVVRKGRRNPGALTTSAAPAGTVTADLPAHRAT